MTMTSVQTITITRRTRSLGYGVTSNVTREGTIAAPKRQIVGLTPRTLIAGRRDEVRSVGGHPEDGSGCYFREGFWVGKRRVVLTDGYNRRDLLWDLEELVAGYQQSITVTVVAKGGA